MNKTELRTRVLLALQVALLGAVTERMRSVLVSWTASEVRVRLFFANELTKADLENSAEIETELASHLPDQAISCAAFSCVPGEKVVPGAGEVFVYQRARA